MIEWRRVVTLALRGARFDGSLRIADVAELETFQALVTDLSAAIWRRQHPDRVRLPRGFEAATQLRFDHVEEGSSAVPLEARTSQSFQATLFDTEEERDAVYASVIAAIDLASRGVVAASRGERVPEDLPRDSIARLGSLGSTLGADESLVVRPTDWQDVSHLPTVSAAVRDNIAAQVPGRYQDAVRLRGHITAADVANGRFVIHDERSRSISGIFTPEQELTVTTALRDHDSVVVEIDGEAIYEPDGTPYRIVAVTAIRDVVAIGGDAEEARALWLQLAALGRTGAATGIPADASENLDHYLYGERD